MTISSATSKAGPFSGDGATATFPFAFICSATSDLNVIATDALGIDATLSLGADYSVTLNADQTVSPGGTVITVTAPAVGTELTILRNVALTQGASFPNQGGFYPKVIEAAFDKLTMIVQQVSEKVSRAVVAGVTQDPSTLVAQIFNSASSAESSATSAAASATSAATNAAAAAASVTAIIKMQQYGAKGDGVTDDTSAFTALEAAHKGLVINLEGATYVVTAIPKKNSYINGTFKVAGDTRQAASFRTPDRAPAKFHAFGGQLQTLHASLCNPLEQMTNITFVGDSITWGNNLPENATSTPRAHQLSDPRDNFDSASFVNEFKRWIGQNYFDNAAPTLSNWVDSSSGQSTATYTRTEQVYTNLPPFSAATLVGSASATETATPGTLLGYRHRLGVADNVSTAEISFTFTGSALTVVYTSIPGTSADYVLTVDGVVIGTYSTDLGVNSYENRHAHTFGYVRNKTVKIKAVYPATGTGVHYLDLEAIEIPKTCAIVNQGIIGTDAREYYNTNFGAHGHTIMTADVNYVFVQLGTNDRSNTFPNYSQPNGINNFGRNLNNLIGALSGASVVLMTANPAASDDPAVYSFGMQDVRNTILGVGAASGIDVIDNYAALQNISTDAVTSDGLHPNLLGHAVIAQNIINAVESGGSGSSFGPLTATTFNGNTITTGTGTLTLDAGKTFRSKNSITLQGTDGTTVTLPSTSATMARTDAAQIFTGNQTFSGILGIGSTSTGTNVNMSANITGATTAFGYRVRGTTMSDVTSASYQVSTFPGTQATAFTLPLLIHFGALQNTFGAGSTVTDQRGFYADGGLTGATYNYGFYGNIAAGINRWNLYMAGTAQNYLAGATGIGTGASASTALALPASTTAVSPVRIAHGAAPTSPVDGDIWTTTAGLFVRINGVTKTVTLT